MSPGLLPQHLQVAGSNQPGASADPSTMTFAIRLIRQRHKRLAVMTRVLALVGSIAVIKLLCHAMGWEIITINPLFSALVASSVFLFGFLLNGVLSDYKESEKLPAEIASALQIVALEVSEVPLHTPEASVAENLASVVDLGRSILAWMRGDVHTEMVISSYYQAHDNVTRASLMIRHAAALQARMQTEMATILRAINRIEVIRETDFVKMVYWLAHISTALLCGGLVISKSDRIAEATFFLIVISFLLIFLLHLIADLDNPFGFNDPDSVENVSLDVLILAQERIEALSARRGHHVGSA